MTELGSDSRRAIAMADAQVVCRSEHSGGGKCARPPAAQQDVRPAPHSVMPAGSYWVRLEAGTQSIRDAPRLTHSAQRAAVSLDSDEDHL